MARRRPPRRSWPRYLDLAIDVVLADVEYFNGTPRWKEGTDELLLSVGGRWDTKKRRWKTGKEPRRGIVIRFQRGQEDAARWICDWLRRWTTNDWAGTDRAWSLLLFGARASGKTHLICALLVIFAVVSPKAIIWAVSPTTDLGAELVQAIESIMPRHWYRRWLAKTGRSTTYLLANRSRILLKSSVRAHRLKAGRVDLVLINEAQDQDQKAYVKIRPRISDRGGLLCLAANPADTVDGLWVEDHLDKARAKEIDGVAFVLDPMRNPWINHESFKSAEKEFDTKTKERELWGRRAPPGDVVMHEWRDDIHWRDPEDRFVDITAELLGRELGAAVPRGIGADFQKSPHMAARCWRLFRDPRDTLARSLLWFVDEADVKGDEYALIDELALLGYDGDNAAAIMDASGFYQNGAHHKGKTSAMAFMARDWRWLFRPQKDSDANPAIAERMRSANALLKQRRLFVSRACKVTATNMRRFPNRNGRPNESSEHSHGIAAVTYTTYRLFGVPVLPSKGLAFTPIPRRPPPDLFGGARDD